MESAGGSCQDALTIVEDSADTTKLSGAWLGAINYEMTKSMMQSKAKQYNTLDLLLQKLRYFFNRNTENVISQDQA